MQALKALHDLDDAANSRTFIVDPGVGSWSGISDLKILDTNFAVGLASGPKAGVTAGFFGNTGLGNSDGRLGNSGRRLGNSDGRLGKSARQLATIGVGGAVIDDDTQTAIEKTQIKDKLPNPLSINSVAAYVAMQVSARLSPPLHMSGDTLCTAASFENRYLSDIPNTMFTVLLDDALNRFLRRAREDAAAAVAGTGVNATKVSDCASGLYPGSRVSSVPAVSVEGVRMCDKAEMVAVYQNATSVATALNVTASLAGLPDATTATDPPPITDYNNTATAAAWTEHSTQWESISLTAGNIPSMFSATRFYPFSIDGIAADADDAVANHVSFEISEFRHKGTEVVDYLTSAVASTGTVADVAAATDAKTATLASLSRGETLGADKLGESWLRSGH
jgi:hypothetical protein